MGVMPRMALLFDVGIVRSMVDLTPLRGLLHRFLLRRLPLSHVRRMCVRIMRRMIRVLVLSMLIVNVFPVRLVPIHDIPYPTELLHPYSAETTNLSCACE
jgi:hypothetical protein